MKVKDIILIYQIIHDRMDEVDTESYFTTTI